MDKQKYRKWIKEGELRGPGANRLKEEDSREERQSVCVSAAKEPSACWDMQ